MDCFKGLVDRFCGSFFTTIKFQKQFVDDVILNVKRQNERLNHRNHELRNRAIRLHLDRLEEEYLCCLCGRPGEEQGSDEPLEDEFSIVHMPSREQIDAAVLACGGAENDRTVTAGRREGEKEEGEPPARARVPLSEHLALDSAGSSATHPNAREIVERTHRCVLSGESVRKKKKKKRLCHRDKGLMKIEESNIDMFEHFFKRPLHGYLCWDCYNSAKKRLDTLTAQIKVILYKGKNPFLRGRCRRINESHGKDMSAPSPSSFLPFMAESEPRICRKRRHNVASLSNATISSLRSGISCAVCKRRQATFFLRQSVMFLCQFCCARDRFYRDNAICINDEFMPRETAHLLKSLVSCYKKTKNMEGEDLASVGTQKHSIDLFAGHNAVDLFAAQPSSCATITVKPAFSQVVSLLDRRAVVGNQSVSLFSGKEFQQNLIEFWEA